MNGDHNRDLGPPEDEEDADDYLEEDSTAAADGEQEAAANKTVGASLSGKLTSAKAALLNFRLPTATEIKKNYMNSNFHKSLNQPLVVKTRIEAKSFSNMT